MGAGGDTIKEVQQKVLGQKVLGQKVLGQKVLGSEVWKHLESESPVETISHPERLTIGFP
jgi:hypothetical protein